MTLDEAAKEFELDCKIRRLSPKTIDNYGKQLRSVAEFQLQHAALPAEFVLSDTIKKLYGSQHDEETDDDSAVI